MSDLFPNERKGNEVLGSWSLAAICAREEDIEGAERGRHGLLDCRKASVKFLDKTMAPYFMKNARMLKLTRR